MKEQLGHILGFCLGLYTLVAWVAFPILLMHYLEKP